MSRAPIEWPEELVLSSTLATLLGRPNFWCGPWAHRYRDAGFVIPPKAELEQAFIIHRMVLFYGRHGEGWATAMADELERIESGLEPSDGV